MKENKFFIDTNIFIRAFIEDHPVQQKECLGLVNSIITGSKLSFYTSELVLAEIVWVLESFYKFDKEKSSLVLDSILAISALSVRSHSDSKIALEIYRSTNVKFIDALIASDPKIFSKSISVVSYDKDFDKIGVKRVEPKDLL